MMTGNSFPRGVLRRSSRATQLERGALQSVLFLSSRFTTFNAVQANEVQAVPSSMSGSASILHPQDEAMEQADASRW
jgi:hypothetical protein